MALNRVPIRFTLWPIYLGLTWLCVYCVLHGHQLSLPSNWFIFCPFLIVKELVANLPLNLLGPPVAFRCYPFPSPVSCNIVQSTVVADAWASAEEYIPSPQGVLVIRLSSNMLSPVWSGLTFTAAPSNALHIYTRQKCTAASYDNVWHLTQTEILLQYVQYLHSATWLHGSYVRTALPMASHCNKKEQLQAFSCLSFIPRQLVL